MKGRKRPSLLRGWLAGQGLTNGDFAKALKVSESTVSLIISNHRKPSYDLALKIEKLTGISPRMLFDPPRGTKETTT